MKELPSVALEQIKEQHIARHRPIEHLCQWLSANVSLLEGTVTPAEHNLYLAPVSTTAKDVTQHLRFFKLTIIPYIDAMIKKGNEHDCRQCSGACNPDHSLSIEQIHASHKKIRNAFLNLKPDDWPSYTDAGPDAAFLPLKELIVKLQTAIIELITIEETQLIPRLAEIKKHI